MNRKLNTKVGGKGREIACIWRLNKYGKTWNLTLEKFGSIEIGVRVDSSPDRKVLQRRLHKYKLIPMLKRVVPELPPITQAQVIHRLDNPDYKQEYEYVIRNIQYYGMVADNRLIPMGIQPHKVDAAVEVFNEIMPESDAHRVATVNVNRKMKRSEWDELKQHGITTGDITSGRVKNDNLNTAKVKVRKI